MKIRVIWIGKTNEKYLLSGIDIFIKRLQHYCTNDLIEIKDVKKSSSPEVLKMMEGQEILAKIESDDFVILLDEKGKNLTSIELSEFVAKHQLIATKRLVFVIGGAFGFSDEVYQRANFKLSLSKLTFSHQMVRLFFYEQLYRAFTILRNEKYHNE